MPGTEATGINSEFYMQVTGGPSNSGDGTFIQNRQTWQYTDFLSYVRGKHAISVGGDFRKEAVNRIEDYFTDPDFSFDGHFTGNALADLVMGLPSAFNLQTEVRSDLRHAAMDAYAQDNYKVSRRLTVDAGVRWEPFLPPVDNLNDQICFDPTFKAQSAFYPTAPPGFTFPGPPLSMKSYGSGDPGCPRAMVPNRMKNFAPRLGVNIDPFANGKTSVRAAYGIFWDQARLIAWNRYSTAQPFDENYSTPGLVTLAPSLTGNNVFANSGNAINPFPFIIPRTPEQRAAFSPQYAQNGVPYWPTSAEGTVLPPNFNEGYAGQWNLTIEQEIVKNWVVSASYIGNHGTHLFMSIDYNYAPVSSYDFNLVKPGDPLTPANNLQANQTETNFRRRFAFDGNCGVGTDPLTGAAANNPCLGQTQMEANLGYSNYNAFDLTINHRFDHGFSLMASYVYGKYLDIVSYGAEGGLGPRNPQNFRANYGPSDSDVRNRFTASYIYQLPKMRSAHGILAGVINDWQNQGVVIAQTGHPYTIGSTTDTAATGIGGEYADRVAGVSLYPEHKGVSSYFNSAAFTEPANGTLGTSSKGLLTGPGMVNVDFSLFKEFPVSDKGKFQFRSEFFNLFNHPNYNSINTTLGNTTFGALTGANDGRIAQFALKYLF
jgi:hypothetical protein